MLEDSPQCFNDDVKIFDGRNSSATLLGKYCGSINPVDFRPETTTNNMFITFRSDRSLNYAGFMAKFSAMAVQPLKAMSFSRRTFKNPTIAVIGKEARIHCQVRGGSLNVVISWSKDGKELSSVGPNYTIKNNNLTKKSTLQFDQVSTSDAGVYTCLASDIDNGKNISVSGTLQLKGK